MLTIAAPLLALSLGAPALSPVTPAEGLARSIQRSEAGADARTAEEIVTELEGLTAPEVDRTRVSEPGYQKEYMAARAAYEARLAELALELFEVAPGHELIPELMPVRWNALIGEGEYGRIVDEAKQLIAHADGDEQRVLEGRFWQTLAMLFERNYGESEEAPYSMDEVFAAGETFWKAYPEDPRSAMLMFQIAEGLPIASDKQRSLLAKVSESFPESNEARQAQGMLALLERVGKPVELEFDEALSGERIAMADLAGKVVVLDFWATWCGPCVAEMPEMKRIYEEYKDQGVEFIGVSLDQPESKGGLTKLKSFVQTNEIPWPQYYQGNGWESEFSTSWGITSIPALFVIDQKGRLHHPKARGKLETLLPELLKKNHS